MPKQKWFKSKKGNWCLIVGGKPLTVFRKYTYENRGFNCFGYWDYDISGEGFSFVYDGEFSEETFSSEDEAKRAAEEFYAWELSPASDFV